MKRTGSVVAAVASTTSVLAGAVTCSDPMPDCVLDPKSSQRQKGGKYCGDVDDQEKRRSDPTDRFAPRFDGLRFIETLVTAHR